ncbi:MAG: flagellar biosynthetic protein FliO [Puniceicoccaceae bacterium]
MITILLLVLMAGGLAVALFAVKRYGFVRKPGQGRLKILETRALGGRQFLVVGQYGRDSFLLGVCPGKIEYLARLEEEQQVPFDQLLESDPSQANNT